MKKMVSILVILLFVLAIGCASKPEEQAPAPAPVQTPTLTQVQPAAEPKEAPAAPQAPEANPDGSKTVDTSYTPGAGNAVEEGGASGTLGSKLQDDEKFSPDVPVPEGDIEIMLTPEKTMNASFMNVKAGTTLYWKNYDSFPHVLAVDSGKGFDTKRWAKSEQILNGAIWKYTFETKGDFLVRDMFSGAMRMNVTVE